MCDIYNDWKELYADDEKEKIALEMILANRDRVSLQCPECELGPDQCECINE